MDEILIVDGYNIIHAWPELAKLMDEDMEYARQKLVAEIVQYKSVKGLNLAIVVFDAHMVKGGTGSMEKDYGVEVIYTQEGQKADTVIERLVNKYAKDKRVFVATSDWPEQRIVLGFGAVRLSARELQEDIKNTRANDIDEHLGKVRYGERQLGWRLKGETLDILEKIRRKK